MKTVLRAWPSLLLGLLFLSACLPASTPTATPTPSLLPPSEAASSPTATATPSPTLPPTLAVESVELRGLQVSVWHAFAGETARLFEEQVALFNAYNEWGIVVTPLAYRDYLSLEEAIQAAQGTDNLPTLIIALPEQGLAWQAVGLTVDLIPYLYDPRYGLGIEALADFPKAYFVGPGFPAQRSARFLFYNQTWAQELGFSAPPQTPEEFRQQACAANTAFRADADPQNDGLGGWIVDTHWQTIYAWLLAFGGEVSVDDAYTFRTDSNLAAFSFLKTLFDNACAWLTTAEPLYRPFAERKALFVVGDLADVPTLTAIMRQAGNTDIWIPIPFPGSETPIVVVYGPSYTILKTDERTQLAAWLFVRWMVAPERQALWVEQSGLLPLRFSLTPLLSEYRTASPAWAHAISFLPLAQPTPALASWARVRFLLSDGARFMFQTNWPVEKIPFILDTIQSTADEIATP